VPFIYWLFILSEWAESEARHFLFTVVVILFSLEFMACESHDSFDYAYEMDTNTKMPCFTKDFMTDCRTFVKISDCRSRLLCGLLHDY
jgi:hypothetical protein